MPLLKLLYCVGLVITTSCSTSPSFNPQVQKCPPPFSPIISLDIHKFYSDKNNSIIDEKLKAEYDLIKKPLNNFLNKMVKMADAFFYSDKNEEGICANTWIYSWAKQKALLGDMKTEQAYYERKWMLSGITLAYAKIRSLATKEEKIVIEEWLSTLAQLTMQHSQEVNRSKNNHYYWEGLAVGAVGRMTNNKILLDWSEHVFDQAMNDVGKEGELPLEVVRGQRALHYHLFASAPLVMLASILHKDSANLTRLVSFTFSSIKNSSVISKMAGVPQEKPLNHNMAWLEIYLRLYPNKEIEQFLTPRRPLAYSTLGGN